MKRRDEISGTELTELFLDFPWKSVKTPTNEETKKKFQVRVLPFSTHLSVYLSIYLSIHKELSLYSHFTFFHSLGLKNRTALGILLGYSRNVLSGGI